MTNEEQPDPSAEPAESPSEWYDDEGHLKRWQIGHQPKNKTEWEQEVKAIDAAWGEELRKVRAEIETAKQYELGRRPQTTQEWELEQRIRERNWQQRAEADDRAARRDLDLQVAKHRASGDSTRAWVLVAVVAALVAYPLVAMLAGSSAEDFGQYIAPITGIAGTVLGYWFGQSGAGTPLAAATPVAPQTPPVPDPSPTTTGTNSPLSATSRSATVGSSETSAESAST
jgi:hypothetical protein